MSSKIIDLNKMRAPEIINAIRSGDMKIIQTLVIDGVKNKKIWTQAEVAEMVGVNQSTVHRWIHNVK